MSLISRQIPDRDAELLEDSTFIHVVDSGLFDLLFYQWLLGRVRIGIPVELILSDSVRPESMNLSALYFKHFTDAGGQVYSSVNTVAYPAFVHTDLLVLLPELHDNNHSKPAFRKDDNPAAMMRFKTLFEQCKAGSTIKSAMFRQGNEGAGAWDDPSGPIEIRFSTNPGYVQVNQRFEVAWEVKGADRVRIEPLLGAVPAKGVRVLSAEQNTEFRLDAENRSTRLSATTNITIDPRPKIEYLLSVPTGNGHDELILSPAAGMTDQFGIVKGSLLRLYWRSYNADSCSLDGQSLPLTGQMMLAPDTMRLYQLRAEGPQGSAEISIIIDVMKQPAIEQITLPAATPIAVNTVLNLPSAYKPTVTRETPGHPELETVHTSAVKEPLGRRIRNFFWFCAGADPVLLAQAPVAESARYAGIGGAVFFTGLLAALSGGYALFTAFQNWPAAVLFGLIWGALIFNLDRLIVSSLKKDAGTHNAWLQALPRFLLALILSLVIAKPLELRIFKPEIDSILADEKRDKAIRIEGLFDLKTKKINERIAGIKTETESLFNIRERLYQEYRCECDGTCGTGKVGRGTECERKEAKYQQADQEYQALKTENDRLIAAARSDALAVDQQKKTTLLQWSSTRSDGLVARLEASGKLPFLPGLFILLLILMVEIAPVLSKLLTPAGVYEHATRMAETRFVIRQEELLQQEQQAADQQSDLRLRLHAEELNQQVDQKAAMLRLIADAQLKLVKDQVDNWLDKEREKKG